MDMRGFFLTGGKKEKAKDDSSEKKWPTEVEFECKSSTAKAKISASVEINACLVKIFFG